MVAAASPSPPLHAKVEEPYLCENKEKGHFVYHGLPQRLVQFHRV